MILSKSTKIRLSFFSIIFTIVSIIIFFVYENLQKNIVYFYSPEDLKNLSVTPTNKIRLGGLVKENSLKANANSYVFIITDFKNEIFVEYSGLLPNLFAEGKSVVLYVVMRDKKYFVSSSILAKHDENYMPPEISNTLKKNELKK